MIDVVKFFDDLSATAGGATVTDVTVELSNGTVLKAHRPVVASAALSEEIEMQEIITRQGEWEGKAPVLMPVRQKMALKVEFRLFVDAAGNFAYVIRPVTLRDRLRAVLRRKKVISDAY